MSDIAMCHGETCAYKDQCYRHTAQPNPYMQSWFINIPRLDDGTCDYFCPDDRAVKARNFPTFYIHTTKERKHAIPSAS